MLPATILPDVAACCRLLPSRKTQQKQSLARRERQQTLVLPATPTGNISGNNGGNIRPLVVLPAVAGTLGCKGDLGQ
jgi:hypothetical protein